jgi:hypothetical protein
MDELGGSWEHSSEGFLVNEKLLADAAVLAKSTAIQRFKTLVNDALKFKGLS